jgi:hypothetical protein
MVQGKHQRRHGRGVLLTGLAAVTAAALLAVGAQFVGTAPAKANGGGGGGGGGTTVREVINVPLLPLTNLCNADVIAFSGDMYLTTTTTPRRDGSYTVRTSAVAPNLTGDKIGPLPPYYRYRGSDAENAYTYVAPPPYPASRSVAHWTKLTPQSGSGAPVMYLVVVSRQTVMADGTVVTTAERAYLACRPPR